MCVRCDRETKRLVRARASARRLTHARPSLPAAGRHREVDQGPSPALVWLVLTLCVLWVLVGVVVL